MRAVLFGTCVDIVTIILTKEGVVHTTVLVSNSTICVVHPHTVLAAVPIPGLCINIVGRKSRESKRSSTLFISEHQWHWYIILVHILPPCSMHTYPQVVAIGCCCPLPINPGEEGLARGKVGAQGKVLVQHANPHIRTSVTWEEYCCEEKKSLPFIIWSDLFYVYIVSARVRSLTLVASDNIEVSLKELFLVV